MPETAVIYDSERPEPAARFRSAAALVLRERWRRNRFFRFGVRLLVAVGAAAVLAPWLAPHDDTQGRDVLSRVLCGARLSLLVGVISQSVAVTLGVLLGLVAGYYQRWVDATVMRLADVTLAFPTLLLLIAIAAAVRPSLPLVFVVIGIVGWAAMARIVRAQVLTLKRAEFVLAAEVRGER